MRAIYKIARLELSNLFYSPVAWLLLIFFTFMMGMTFTTSTALAMECERTNAGTASALLGAVCFSFGGIVSPLVGIGNILVSTGVIFVICSFCSCILLALGRRRTKLYFAFSTSQKR